MNKTARFAGHALAVVALAALPLCAISGCTEEESVKGDLSDFIAGDASAEQLLQQSIAQELQNVVLEDETGIADAIMNTSLSDLAQYGIDGVEFLQDYLSELNYDIGDITVNGDTATVEVTINYNSLQALATKVGGDLADFIAGFDLDQLPIEEIESLLSPILTATLSTISETISQSMLLDFEFVNGEWQLTDQSKVDVMSALLEG